MTRPWTIASRHLPPAALCSSNPFLAAKRPCAKALFTRDDEWSGPYEEVYVKQKGAGEHQPGKLRAIIPISPILRLLTSVVLDAVLPYSDQCSTEQGLGDRVLGASKRGQPLDIASTTPLS